MAAFCRARGAKATLVFDGHPLRPDMAAQDLGPLSLRVPPPGEDADTVIRELVDRAPRAADYVVVTSDKALYSYAKTAGAPGSPRPRVERDRAAVAGGAQAGSEKPEREDDVEGWLRRFRGE